MGVGTVVFVAVMVAVLAVVGVTALVDVIRDRPAERVWHVWNPTARHCAAGVPWPEHDEDYEDCGCRSCYSVEITLMQPIEVESIFLGRVDTPECHELANLARRWVP